MQMVAAAEEYGGAGKLFGANARSLDIELWLAALRKSWTTGTAKREPGSALSLLVGRGQLPKKCFDGF